MYCNLYYIILCSNTGLKILKKTKYSNICASLLIRYMKNKRINEDIDD